MEKTSIGSYEKRLLNKLAETWGHGCHVQIFGRWVYVGSLVIFGCSFLMLFATVVFILRK